MPSSEEIKTLAVKIAMDSSSFVQQANTFKKKVQEIDSSFKASIAGIKDWGSNTDKLREQVGNLGSRIDIQKQVVSSYQGQIIKTNAALEAHSKELLENKDRVAQLKAAYEQSVTTVGKNADATQNLKKQLDDAEQALSRSENQVRRNQSAIDGYNTQLNNATGKLNTMEAELKNANSALFDHTNAIAKAGKALQDAGGKISTAGSKLSGIGTTLTAAVTAPIVGVGVAAEKTGIDFEAQMSRVQAISGATGNQLQELTKTAMDLGAKTSYSDQEVAEGMENMAAAGFSVNEIMQSMPGMLNLAASSGEDLASSADIAATTLRGFGLSADQAGHVADVLAKNASQTNAAVADTGLAMQYIAPLAQNAGWSLEQVTAAIGEMADKGIKGEKAGTALRGALTNLINPSKDQAEAIKEVGLQVYNSQGKMNSLSSIVDQLQKGTSKMTDAQRDNVVATIMGTDALSGMQALISDGSQALDTMTDSLKNSDGASQDMANTMLNNTKGSMEQMKGSVENAGVALSKVLSPTVKDVADKVTDLANKFANSSDATKKQVVQFAAIAAAIGPAFLGVGKLAEGIGKTTTVLGKGAKGVAEFVKGVKGIESTSEETVPLLQKFGLALSANPAAQMAGAIGLVITAVGTLAIAMNNYKTPNQEFVKTLQDEVKAWKDVKKAADDKAGSDMAEINNTQALWNQLQGLVDENGKVKGSKEEVKELVDIINSTTGKEELKLVGDQILKYKDAKATIDEYIKSKQAQILIDAYSDKYKQALTGWQDDLAKVVETKGKIAEDQAKIEKLESTPSQANNLMKAKYEEDLKSLQKSLSGYSSTVNEKLNFVNTYQDAMSANTEKNYDKVNQILGTEPLKYAQAAGATKTQLGQQVLDMKNQLDQLVTLKNTGEAKVTDAQIQAMQQRYQDAQTEYDKAVGQAGAAAKLTGTTYSDNLDSTAGRASAAGKNVGNAAANGANSTTGNSANAGAAHGSALASGVDSKSGDLNKSGQNAANSIKNGANSVKLDETGSNLAAQIKAGWELYFKFNPLSIAINMIQGKSLSSVGHNAAGTDFWRGGLTYINERGGELVNLPTGTQIIPHDVSMEIARAVGQAVGSNITGGRNINIHVDKMECLDQGDKRANLQQLQFFQQL